MPVNTVVSAHNYGSEQQWLVSLSVKDAQGHELIPVDKQVFDTFSGGDVTAPAVKHRPGGMGYEVTYNSLPSFSDIMLGRVYETQRDHALVATLHAVAGRVLASVTLTPLDENGSVWGPPRIYSGRLIGVKDGKTDSNSNAPRMLEIDIAVESMSG